MFTDYWEINYWDRTCIKRQSIFPLVACRMKYIHSYLVIYVYVVLTFTNLSYRFRCCSCGGHKVATFRLINLGKREVFAIRMHHHHKILREGKPHSMPMRVWWTNGLAWILHSQDSGFEANFQEVFFWYGPLANHSLQIASVGSDHHGKNNGGPNQWIIRVSITPRLLKIHLFLLVKSSWISAGDA